MSGPLRVACLLALVASAGCIRGTIFNCESNGECGAGGVCEATSAGMFCSFADGNCASGRAFGDSSGPLSGQCTNMTTVPPEAMGNEMMGNEMQAVQCPTGYNTLPSSGSRGHRYRLVGQNRSWTQHRDDCAMEGATAGKSIYLAFPDGPQAAMELAALRALAGDGAWVGVNDIAVNNQYRNSLNQLISAQTQALINTSGGPGDCLVISGNDLDDVNCADNRMAVCECVP